MQFRCTLETEAQCLRCPWWWTVFDLRGAEIEYKLKVKTLSFYISHQSLAQDELRVLWPTLLLFKIHFVSTGITQGKHCLTKKMHSRHDFWILITSNYNSGTLLSNQKFSCEFENYTAWQCLSRCVVIRALFWAFMLCWSSCEWWPLVH